MSHFKIDSDWTLFLDRDGVINERNFDGYITTPEKFHFLPGVLEAIAQLTPRFKYIFVVTNQQGIGKGIMTESNLLEIHDYMLNQVASFGGKITDCFFAPELKSENAMRRKPNIGMGIEAKAKFKDIDFTKSVMVGDTDSDILFGQNLGMKTVRIKTKEPISIEADISVLGLIDLARLWEK
jgi:D-glycero-D-manno-heptose 1,7-bisphosphate phosphatase